jgi:hypothetical protein
MNSAPLSFEAINNGKAMKRANEAIREAAMNCLDPATPLLTPRVVSITVTLNPLVGSRERSMIQASVSSKLVEAGFEPQTVQLHLVKKTAYVELVEEVPLFEHKPLPLAAGEVPTLEQINEGRVLAEINLALQHCVENLANPDTPVKGKRSVVCQLKFINLEQSGKRGPLGVQPTVNTKLQARAIPPAHFTLQPVTVSEADYPMAYDETARKGESTYVQ